MITQPKTFQLQSKVEQFRTRIESEEACKLTGLCYITFYANFRKDNIPHERIGRNLYFLKEDILEYIENHKIGDWSKVKDKNILLDEKFDIKEVCHILGLCYDTFYGIMRRKNFPRFQYGTKIVFCKSTIQEYINSCKRYKWEKQ